MNTIKYLFIILSFIPLISFSQQETHGGDVLVCPGKSPIVLDYYYANLTSPNDPSPPVDITNFSTKEVLAYVDGVFAGSFFADSFNSNSIIIGNLSNWLEGEGLSDINDNGFGFKIPPNCNLEQAAVRVGHFVYIDKQMATRLSPAQLGVLVLHEILYKMAVDKGGTNSSKVRNFVRAIFRKNKDYTSLGTGALDIGWRYSYFQNWMAQPNNAIFGKKFHATFEIPYAELPNRVTARLWRPDKNIPFLGGEIELFCDFSDECKIISVNYGGEYDDKSLTPTAPIDKNSFILKFSGLREWKVYYKGQLYDQSL